MIEASAAASLTSDHGKTVFTAVPATLLPAGLVTTDVISIHASSQLHSLHEGASDD
jgi:hypothetical protein